MIITAATIVPMLTLAYWLCFKTKPGLLTSTLIFLGVSVLSVAWGPSVGAGVAFLSGIELPSAMFAGMVAGLICVPLLMVTVWMARKKARGEAAVAWKYR